MIIFFFFFPFSPSLHERPSARQIPVWKWKIFFFPLYIRSQGEERTPSSPLFFPSVAFWDCRGEDLVFLFFIIIIISLRFSEIAWDSSESF